MYFILLICLHQLFPCLIPFIFSSSSFSSSPPPPPHPSPPPPPPFLLLLFLITVPSKVQNVRVYVYFPIRNDISVVSAQIVWDGLSLFDAGGVVELYSVEVIDVIDNELITAGNVFNVS